MSVALASQSAYVIVGAGIHGLSTAYHLALELKARGKGDGRDITVIDKTGSPVNCALNWRDQEAFLDLVTHRLTEIPA